MPGPNLVAFRNVVQRSVNDANNDFNLDSGTTGVDHSLVNILGIGGVGGGGDITQSRTLYLEYTNLPISAIIDPANDYLVFYDSSTGNHYRVLISSSVTAASPYVQYIDDDCTITANDTGITVSRAGGTVTVTIPTGIHMSSINITGVLADLDAKENFYVELIYEGESMINQDLVTAVLPVVGYINTSSPMQLNGGIADNDNPAQYDPNKTYAVVQCEPSGADAVLKLKFESIIDDNFIIKLNF